MRFSECLVAVMGLYLIAWSIRLFSHSLNCFVYCKELFL
nr:MAG TPA: hypothetical protein [Caudoviricetes sp.]